jgi:hypothetical protein
MFLLTVFTGHYGSIAEEFLLEKCLTDELEKLYKGIFINIEGQKYFLQARLIMHVWDTKAVEKQLKCKCTGSYPGCMFCSDMYGFLISELNNLIVFPGHRGLLEEEHYLRQFGQSQKCCPKYYFNYIEDLKVNQTVLYLVEADINKWTIGTISKINEDKREFSILTETVINKKNEEKEKFARVSCKNILVYNKVDDTVFKKNDRVLAEYNKTGNWFKGTITGISEDQNHFAIRFDDSDFKKVTKNEIRSLYNEKINEIENFKSSVTQTGKIDSILESMCGNISKEKLITVFNNKEFIWHHKNVDKKVFLKHLYYEHCDYRKQLTNKRVTNQAYVDNGKLAIQKDDCIQGVKGLWFAHKLSYSNMSNDTNWDSFHTIANNGKHFIRLCAGSHGYSDGLQLYCKKTNCHPSLVKARNVYELPWVFSENTQKKVDAYINAIIVPVGYSSQFEVKNIFLYSSYTKGIGHIQIMTCLMNYILSVSELNLAYIKFYQMLSSDIIHLLCPAFENDEELEELKKKLLKRLL